MMLFSIHIVLFLAFIVFNYIAGKKKKRNVEGNWEYCYTCDSCNHTVEKNPYKYPTFKTVCKNCGKVSEKEFAGNRKSSYYESTRRFIYREKYPDWAFWRNNKGNWQSHESYLYWQKEEEKLQKEIENL